MAKGGGESWRRRVLVGLLRQRGTDEDNEIRRGVGCRVEHLLIDNDGRERCFIHPANALARVPDLCLLGLNDGNESRTKQ